MKSRCCLSCKETFLPRPQNPNQKYCSNPSCQRSRQRAWLKEKIKSDPDYRDNQARAQEKWSKSNPGYWKKYRSLNTDYANKNRSKQRIRNARAYQKDIVKIDVSGPTDLLCSGLYRMVGISMDGIAKSDAWMVSITVLPTPRR